MKRLLPVATLLLFAMPLTASAQSLGIIGTVGSPGSSFGDDIMSGKSYDTSGVNAVVSPGSTGRFPDGLDKYSARDGCINYPGQAHNSADCSRIISWDPSWVLPNKPLDKMTGAEENMVRSYNILNHKNAQTR
jgi:hypothetical protein